MNSMYAMFIQFIPLIVILIGVAIGFFVMLFISFLVYRDAKKRGLNALLWAAIVFFTGLIGLLVYFLLIRPKKKAVPPPP